MALVSTVNTTWQNITGKELSRQSVLTSKMKEVVICFAIGMCAYPACAAGYAVDLSAGGRITTLLSVEVGNISDGACNVDGFVTEYRYAACCAAATGTLHIWETGGAINTPLDELPACAACLNGAVIRFRVIGI